MRSLWRPLHLLLDHALAHDLVDRGLGERCADPLAIAVALAIVDDRGRVVADKEALLLATPPTTGEPAPTAVG